MLDLAILGSASLLRGCAQLGLATWRSLGSSGSHCEALLAVDLGHPDPPPSLQSHSHLGSSTFCLGLMRLDFISSPPVVDVTCLDFSPSSRSCAYPEPSSFAPSFAHIELPPSLRSSTCLEAPASLLGLSRFDSISFLLVLSSTDLGLSLPLRSPARLGAAMMTMDLVHLDPMLSSRSSTCMGFMLFLLQMARSEARLPASDSRCSRDRDYVF